MMRLTCNKLYSLYCGCQHSYGMRFSSRSTVQLFQKVKPKIVSHEEHVDQIVKTSIISDSDINVNVKKVENPKKGHTTLDWTVTPSDDRSKYVKRYLLLSKSRLTSLVVITSMAGYAVAPAPFELTSFIFCSVGTGLLSGAANAINQYHEVPFDAQMSRTKNRVLVKGMLTPAHAIAFAATSAVAGLSILHFGVNDLTSSLGLANLILYTSIYTPMKRFSIINTWIGSIVGAIPPMMGWAACTGGLDSGAWILAGLLYAWQFPHFNALSWNLRPDYSRAGYRMMSVTNPALCRRTALRYTGAIVVLSLAAPLLDVTNIWFALESLPLNAYFLYLAWKFYKNSDSGTSRQLFRFSLLHLPALMLLLLINKKHWYFGKSKEEHGTDEANNVQQIFQTNKSVSSPTKPLSNVLPVAIAASSDS